ncbi:MAG: MFS transporter [Gammaproteobacteria bacterium]|nr:MFS transporter [Gammaproteobacteria bacterium]MDH3447933.1 MFS transporter [Gammaproteobacteria bacterium]
MKRLWLILATLTLARMTMGFQFQSVATVGPLLTSDSIISYTELGALIGIYLLPGAFFAIPGGWLGKRFGDKRIVLTGLAMMTLGGALLAISDVFEIMFIGRLVSGMGAVLLNVLVTKMVTDWFAEYRITTAMGVLISSWPLGIAIALLTLGPIAGAIGLQLAFFVSVAICAIALLLVASIYSNPPEPADADLSCSRPVTPKLTRFEFLGVVLSGCVWCFYNIAFILVLSFGPEFLVREGMTLISAGAIVSIASWLVIPALPIGAWVAEHIGRPTLTIVVTFLGISLLIMAIPFTTSYVMIFAAIGIIFGPAGGLIMALPAQVLQKENRAIGMGIFFTIYYAGMGIFPAIAGYAREVTGNPVAPLVLAGVAILFAILALASLRILQIRHRSNTSVAQKI